jgi:ParB family transcriptional regulator, chromosome partitioning protein
VSGHNRSDVYRELGRELIKGIIGESASLDDATSHAFFANLMQSDLTDYEKYTGIKRFHDQHPDLTQAQVGEHIGVSQSHLSALLSFDRLPADALSILETHKAIIGATAVAELAALTDGGKGPRVVEAIRQLSEAKLDQSQAVRFARGSEGSKKAPAPSVGFKVKAGKSTWCDVRRAKNVMRLEFQSEELAQAVQDAIKQHLETLVATYPTSGKAK